MSQRRREIGDSSSRRRLTAAGREEAERSRPSSRDRP